MLFSKSLNYLWERSPQDYRYAIDGSKIRPQLSSETQETFATGISKTLEMGSIKDSHW